MEKPTTRLYLDVETCGLHGMPVLMQFAYGDDEVVLYDIWKNPIKDTLRYIESFTDCCVVGFNLAFDWFHISKIYTTLSMFRDHNELPEDHIEELAILEKEARFGPCVKPRTAFDLMLHARKGPYQALMAREDIKIKKVPTDLAWMLAAQLESTIEIDNIYFERKKDKSAPRWSVRDTKHPDFKDVVLVFSPSGALKTLARHALGAQDILKFTDIELDRNYWPKELGYAPFALSLGKPGDWRKTWPQMIPFHISHWAYNSLARQYATKDIDYTRGLDKLFVDEDGEYRSDDDDSILACSVASVRWKGFAIDREKIFKLRQIAFEKTKQIPRAPTQVKRYLKEVMGEMEASFLDDQGTKRQVLEEIITAPEWEGHPAVERAKLVLDSRQAKKEVELYDKLLHAGRFHASFKVIGTLSSRMAGSDGLNPQGINAADFVRDCFTLADMGTVLCGGDFDSFEVALAVSAYGDERLAADIQSGRKIHALLGAKLKQVTYEQVMSSKGKAGTEDFYHIGKQGVFALIYGGDENTLQKKLNIPLEIGKKALDEFFDDYKEIKKSRNKIFNMFCSMRQDGGPGRPVTWAEPSEYIESLFGFRRYFTLENKICKALFNLAEKPPKEWKEVKRRVIRNRGVQTATGATRSAIFAAAFNIQAAAMRAAANHVIQSSGATITKRLQRRVWDLQPHGVQPWVVQPMNVHDECLTVAAPEIVSNLESVVKDTVESFRQKVPLIAMDWISNLASWSKGLNTAKVAEILANPGNYKPELVSRAQEWPFNSS